MMHSLDPSDIDNWANRHASKGQLPTLISRLIQETLPDSEPRKIDVPSESCIYYSGWDAILEVGQGNSWVPEGVSGWEFSCDKNINKVADENYEKRTDNPLGIDPQTSTYVFVTAKKWGGKRSWLEKRGAEQLWRDVRAYDAGDLAMWMGNAADTTRYFLSISQNFQGIFQISDQIDNLSAEVNSLRIALAEQTEQPDSESDQNSEYAKALGILDKVSDLNQQGLVQTARIRLEEIDDEVEQLPANLKFRYLSNLALCELNEDKLEKAASLLIEAHEIQPENAKGLTNASLAARIQQNHNQAANLARRALTLAPNDSVAAANLMSALWDMGHLDQLEGFVSSERWIIDEPDSAEALARIRMQQERHEDAEKIYRDLIERDPENYHALIAMGQCLATRAQKDLAPMLYSRNLSEVFHEVESIANKLVHVLQRTQLVARRHDALLLRAYARSRLNRTDEAMHDVDSVLNDSPRNLSAIQQKGILLLKTGHPNDARDWLEKLRNSDIEFDSLHPLADAYLESGDATTAIVLLKDSFSLDPPRWENVGRAQSLMQAEWKAGHDDSVGPMVKAAFEKYPNDPILFVLSAVRSSLKGDYETTASALVKAINLSNNSIRQMLRSQLGHLYMQMGQFSDAAEQFNHVCGDDITHPDALPMLISLWELYT